MAQAVATRGTALRPRPSGAARNTGIPLDLAWVAEARYTNTAAAGRRATTVWARRSVKKGWRASLLCVGASGLLTDIERQFWHNLTGRDSAAHRHPLP